MSDIDGLLAALAQLRAQEAAMLPERMQLRREFFEIRDKRLAHSREFKVVRDARAEVEARIREAESGRPVSDRVDALINSIAATAAGGGASPEKGA